MRRYIRNRMRFVYDFARWMERRLGKSRWVKARYVDAVLELDWWLERRGLS